MKEQNDLSQKLKDWQEEQKSYIEEIKELVQQLTMPEKIQIICYFTYSLQLNHEINLDNYVIGSFHVQNVGTKPLTNPHIGLTISSNTEFQFSGKYLYPNAKQTLRPSNAWERINDRSDKKEFWLKPIQQDRVNPGETLVFSNFQIKWTPTSTYSGIVRGFTYGNELPNGLHAVNQISVNGSIKDRQQEDDHHEKK
ncbi:hypothetical protein SH601_11520 [Gracilibacillus sp. S3-1-1]|uniref:Uncharacterized protein n=1 Tax=Gracilibacillus pellucidus TaxID=3095368 RepID=A0ACC6M6K5_9BACI|nr:hypothetical protein [Gracilibacillus sp. S3-1-1]MDX8046611.1 hypothetical protein [Gracilibacillus sp. S3-1-1]